MDHTSLWKGNKITIFFTFLNKKKRHIHQLGSIAAPYDEWKQSFNSFCQYGEWYTRVCVCVCVYTHVCPFRYPASMSVYSGAAISMLSAAPFWGSACLCACVSAFELVKEGSIWFFLIINKVFCLFCFTATNYTFQHCRRNKQLHGQRWRSGNQ